MRTKSSSVNRYRRLVIYAQRRWPALAGIIFLTLISALVTALMPWPIKILVDYALGDVASPALLQNIFDYLSLAQTAGLLIVMAGAISLLLFVISSALDVALTLIWSSTGQRMVYDLATDLFDRLCTLTLVFHSRQPVGDSLSRLSIDTYSVFAVVQGLLVAPIRQVFTLCTVAVFAWVMDPQLTLMAFVLAPLMVVTATLIGARLKARAKAQREAQSQIMSLVQRTLAAIPVVQAFGAEQRNQLEFENLSTAAVARSQRSVLLVNSFGFMNGFLMTTGTAIVLFFGSQRVLAGELSIGSLLIFVAYLETIRGAMLALVSIYGSLKVTEASIDRVFEILDSSDAVEERPGAAELVVAADVGIGELKFEKVSVGYEAGRAVLSDITLEVKAGETIALVGPTGSGKSTLASLLPRFIDPWEGRVTIDGQDIRDIRLSSLRDHIGLVLQEPFLLPISVAANIAYGRPEASQAEIIAAARAANADEFIRELPEGYDTVMAERGATLSGGQSQRISIARALLKDAPILILDEPTSALDAETEALLLAALERLMSGRTTFIIAHRLSTIRHADQIVVLENGRIVENGRHEQLLYSGGYYQRAYGLQFSEPVAEGMV
jgi:ATP-binding cassette subfamily B protein